MSSENEVSTESASVEPASTPEVSTPAVESAPAAAAASEGAAPAANEPPPYSPNFKFKANQKELEFDEFVRPAIKTAEVEKKIRELYEKAHGLDTIKPERDELKQKYNAINTEYSGVQKGIHKLNHYVQQKDYESFFSALNIPKADVMQYALLQLKLQEATPEQRQAYEQHRQATMQAEQLREENQMLQGTLEQQSVAQRTNELDGALQKSEVSPVMQAFDSRVGRIGAFRDEVIKRGKLYAHQGQDITVDQAVTEVLNLLGHQAPSAQQAAPAVAPPKAMGDAKKPVIPNFQGRGTSPAKKVVKSIDDLKNYAKQRIAEENTNIG